MERNFLEQLRVGEQPLPAEVIDAIWEQCQRDAQSFAQQLAQVRFDGALTQAITKAGGRNIKAVQALLDVQALQQSNDPQAVEKAIGQLKKENGWLFADVAVPPYASGTGAVQVTQTEEPQTLAGALRARQTQRV